MLFFCPKTCFICGYLGEEINRGERMNDEEILALIVARKQEGLSHFLDKYGGLMSFILKNIGIFSDDDISECISDILFTVWKKINKYDSSRASFKTWVILVSRGLAIDFLRKKARHANMVSIDELEDLSVSDAEYTKITDNSVISFLQELAPPDNEIFYKRFVLGISVESIAEELGITKDNVYKRISRGREKLKSLMAREGYRYV
jgi:RNA polymerase sigma-70 factor (ECF subfamily)